MDAYSAFTMELHLIIPSSKLNNHMELSNVKTGLLMVHYRRKVYKVAS